MMRKYLFVVAGLLPCLSIGAADKLIVSYATSHLNRIPGAVVGTLITPSGRVLQTVPMGPFDHYNVVVDPPEIGSYQAYFEATQTECFRLCPIIGGIGALLTDQPEKSIPFAPEESRIQAFPSGKRIQIGNISQPVSTFSLTEEDLQ